MQNTLHFKPFTRKLNVVIPITIGRCGRSSGSGFTFPSVYWRTVVWRILLFKPLSGRGLGRPLQLRG